VSTGSAAATSRIPDPLKKLQSSVRRATRCHYPTIVVSSVDAD